MSGNALGVKASAISDSLYLCMAGVEGLPCALLNCVIPSVRLGGTMPAQYKHAQFLALNPNAAFDQIHEPSVQTPYSGIYRCEGCGKCVVSMHPHPLPPQNHHQHTPQQGRIRWRLIVAHD